MARNAECSVCGVTAADLPWEEMGMPDLDEASDLLFEKSGGETYCQGCANG